MDAKAVSSRTSDGEWGAGLYRPKGRLPSSVASLPGLHALHSHRKRRPLYEPSTQVDSTVSL